MYDEEIEKIVGEFIDVCKNNDLTSYKRLLCALAFLEFMTKFKIGCLNCDVQDCAGYVESEEYKDFILLIKDSLTKIHAMKEGAEYGELAKWMGR